MKFSTYCKIINAFEKRIWNLFFSRYFKYYGKNTYIVKPDKIVGEEYITIKDNVLISTQCWLLALKIKNEPSITIGKGTQIGRFVHIVAIESITIENNVLIADKVYISDNYHSYFNIKLPIIQQDILLKKRVVINEGAWIGENVSIIGANIGRGSIVSANAVVTKDVPDYCIVAGVPAKIIKYIE